jgi:hypothetical protein
MKSKLRAISDRELQNIQKIEIDKLISSIMTGKIIVKNIKKIISLKILNSPSPRSSSFLNLTLLDSPNKTLGEPFDSQ